MTDPQTAALAMRDRFVADEGRTPQEINSGMCFDFAEALEGEHGDLFETFELGNLYNHNFAAGEDCVDATGFDAAMIHRICPNWNPPAGFTWQTMFDDCGLSWTGTHGWAFCAQNGLSYDIENPEGVTNVFDLAFFQRIFAAYRARLVEPAA
jgi:hypothetical protein